jgi:hypothetical protein
VLYTWTVVRPQKDYVGNVAASHDPRVSLLALLLASPGLGMTITSLYYGFECRPFRRTWTFLAVP